MGAARNISMHVQKPSSQNQSSPQSKDGLSVISGILAGELSLASVADQEKKPPTETEDLCAVFFRDWTAVPHVFVIEGRSQRNFYPCILLSRSDEDGWEVKPFVFDFFSQETVRLEFTEQWLRILLDLTTEELDPLLPDPTIPNEAFCAEQDDGLILYSPPPDHADLRLNAFSAGGYRAFLSDERARRKWFIASQWPKWMAHPSISQDEAACEVAAEEGLKIYPSDTLRKMLKEMGLRWPSRLKRSKEGCQE